MSHQDLQEEQETTLLFSLQSSARNALHTFGASSPQYQTIILMLDEHTLKTARVRAERERERLVRRVGSRAGLKDVQVGEGGQGVNVMNLALRPRGG